MGGVPNAWWNLDLTPGELTLPAGTYTVIDSDPDTWSKNAKSGNAGFFAIKWEPYGSGTSGSSGSPGSGTGSGTKSLDGPGISGKWKWFTGQIVNCYNDGTFESFSNGKLDNSGTWKGGGYSYTVYWKNGGYIDTLALSEDGKKLNGTGNTGVSVSGTRLS